MREEPNGRALRVLACIAAAAVVAWLLARALLPAQPAPALLGFGALALLVLVALRRGSEGAAPAVDSSVPARSAAEEVAEREREYGELLGMLAHDLRNPLSPMRTSLQLLRMGAQDAARTSELLDVADRQSAELVRELDRLAELAAIARGRVAPQREPTDLVAIASDALESLSGSALLRRISARLAPGQAPMPLTCDRRLVAHAIAALVEHSAHGAMTGNVIVVTIAREGDGCAITVGEQSPEGIREPARAQRSGLPLALAGEIARVHEGTLVRMDDAAGWRLQLPDAPAPAA